MSENSKNTVSGTTIAIVVVLVLFWLVGQFSNDTPAPSYDSSSPYAPNTQTIREIDEMPGTLAEKEQALNGSTIAYGVLKATLGGIVGVTSGALITSNIEEGFDQEESRGVVMISGAIGMLVMTINEVTTNKRTQKETL